MQGCFVWPPCNRRAFEMKRIHMQRCCFCGPPLLFRLSSSRLRLNILLQNCVFVTAVHLYRQRGGSCSHVGGITTLMQITYNVYSFIFMIPTVFFYISLCFSPPTHSWLQLKRKCQQTHLSGSQFLCFLFLVYILPSPRSLFLLTSLKCPVLLGGWLCQM